MLSIWVGVFHDDFPGWGRSGIDEGIEVFASRSFGSDAQKAFTVKRGEEGVPVAEICREAGISQAPYFNWCMKYAGLMPSEMKRLQELEQENALLKKIVGDLSLDTEMLQDIVKRMYGPPRRCKNLGCRRHEFARQKGRWISG